MDDDSVVAGLTWKQFENLLTVALEARKSKDSDGLLNLVEDVLEVRRVVGKERINEFAQSLYCYDLIQQVYSQYFAQASDGVPQKKIGAKGVLSLASRLSPASMTLALLSCKEDNFDSVSKDAYDAWTFHKRALEIKLMRLDYNDLSREAREYFPRVRRPDGCPLDGIILTNYALKIHREICDLISTQRFKHLHYDCATCGRLDCYCSSSTNKLHFSFREIQNTDYEVQMFQKIWFLPVHEADTISVSANLSGFTMINAVSRALRYDWDHVKEVAKTANQNKKVICLQDLTPRLIIVPRTDGKDDSLTRKLLTQVINDANALGTKILHMTHYGFCNNLSYGTDPSIIFRELLNPHLSTEIESVVFDCDSRAKDRMFDVFKSSISEYKAKRFSPRSMWS